MVSGASISTTIGVIAPAINQTLVLTMTPEMVIPHYHQPTLLLHPWLHKPL